MVSILHLRVGKKEGGVDDVGMADLQGHQVVLQRMPDQQRLRRHQLQEALLQQHKNNNITPST